MRNLAGLREAVGMAALAAVVATLVGCGDAEAPHPGGGGAASGGAGDGGSADDGGRAGHGHGGSGASASGGNASGGNASGGNASGGNASGGSGASGGSAQGGSAQGGSGGAQGGGGAGGVPNECDGGVAELAGPDAGVPVPPKVTFDASDLQLNDVSLLFPLPKDEPERDDGLLPMSARGARGKLLPEALYEGVGPIFGSKLPPPGYTGAGDAPYESLRVVALRVDPCFASLAPPADGKGCQNQLRLVVQEAGVGTASDSGLHLFYAITRAEALQLVSTIAGLRQKLAPKQVLGKLQPHPVMVKEGLLGEMSQGVRAAILAHAGVSNLIRITRMEQAGDGPFWNFSGFDVAGCTLKAMQLPSLTAPSVQQTIVRGFGAFRGLEATPSSASSDDFMLASKADEAKMLPVAEQKALFTSLLRVEDPRAHSPDTVDCASCHAATPIKKLVLEPTLGWSSEGLPAFEANPALFGAADLLPSYGGDTQLIMNVHSFSYFGKELGISQRVVNESAAVVDYLSKQDFGAR